MPNQAALARSSVRAAVSPERRKNQSRKSPLGKELVVESSKCFVGQQLTHPSPRQTLRTVPNSRPARLFGCPAKELSAPVDQRKIARLAPMALRLRLQSTPNK